MRSRIEHKIVKEKDYNVVFIIGFLWLVVCSGLSYGSWWLIKVGTNNVIVASIFATLCFCYGLYHGRSFFQPEYIERVEHFIKKVNK